MEVTGPILDRLFAPPGPAVRGIGEAEAMTLAVAVVGAAVLLRLHRSGALPRHPRMLAGCAFLFGAYAATVAEGFLWSGLFALAEHLCLALSGLFFLLSIYELGHPRFSREKEAGGGGGEG